MRACELEALPDFAMGDDTYAAVPGVVRGFLSQYTSVPGELVMPSDNADPEQEAGRMLNDAVSTLMGAIGSNGVDHCIPLKLPWGGQPGIWHLCRRRVVPSYGEGGSPRRLQRSVEAAQRVQIAGDRKGP
jgi:hypothetical protein